MSALADPVQQKPISQAGGKLLDPILAPEAILTAPFWLLTISSPPTAIPTAGDFVVKVDVEGAEWDALRTLTERTALQFSQLVIELHHLTAIDRKAPFERIVEALQRINRTHQAVHVHANNYGMIGFYGGVTLPETLEVTYARREAHLFKNCTRCFPTSLDMPNNPAAADYFLGYPGSAITDKAQGR